MHAFYPFWSSLPFEYLDYLHLIKSIHNILTICHLTRCFLFFPIYSLSFHFSLPYFGLRVLYLQLWFVSQILLCPLCDGCYTFYFYICCKYHSILSLFLLSYFKGFFFILKMLFSLGSSHLLPLSKESLCRAACCGVPEAFSTLV